MQADGAYDWVAARTSARVAAERALVRASEAGKVVVDGVVVTGVSDVDVPDGRQPCRSIERAGRDADSRALGPLPEHGGAARPAEAAPDAGRGAIPAQARLL